MTHAARLILVLLAAGVAGFQIALALGAPLGVWTMGGRFTGALPGAMRLVAFAQAGLLIWLCGAVWRDRHLRLVSAVLSLSALANLLSPSAPERQIFIPVSLVMLACALWLTLRPWPALS